MLKSDVLYITLRYVKLIIFPSQFFLRIILFSSDVIRLDVIYFTYNYRECTEALLYGIALVIYVYIIPKATNTLKYSDCDASQHRPLWMNIWSRHRVINDCTWQCCSSGTIIAASIIIALWIAEARILKYMCALRWLSDIHTCYCLSEHFMFISIPFH